MTEEETRMRATATATAAAVTEVAVVDENDVLLGVLVPTALDSSALILLPAQERPERKGNLNHLMS